MTQKISPADLRDLIENQATFALLDVREQGEHSSAHIPGSSPVPRRLLEFKMLDIVPFKGTAVVLYDDDGRRAELAGATLEGMGYRDIAILEGGIIRWATEGYFTEWGLNVPSKAFGEKVQVKYEVPEMECQELYDRLQRGEEVVILDSRTPEEHQRVCIPGSRSMPNGELALRFGGVVKDPDVPVVVHCAGRTRSIIGARTLQRMGRGNVYDLKNGTMGWVMAGLELETGSQRLELPQASPEDLAAAEDFANKVAAEDGVRRLNVKGLQEHMARADRENIYLIDVRTEEEFTQGHIPGFRWYPGGQAVQQSDDVSAIKNAQIVFSCDGHVRSSVTGSWYRQMGFANVHILDGGVSAWTASGLPLEKGMPEKTIFGYQEAKEEVKFLSPQELRAALDGAQPPAMVFVDTSRDFSSGHVSGAHWIPRGSLELTIDEIVPSRESPVAVICSGGLSSVLAGATLKGLGYQKVSVLKGGMKAWKAAGLPVEMGLSGVMKPPTDMRIAGSEGNSADMIHYLQWEEALGYQEAQPLKSP